MCFKGFDISVKSNIKVYVQPSLQLKFDRILVASLIFFLLELKAQRSTYSFDVFSDATRN